MNTIGYIKLVVTLLPTIIELVKLVEAQVSAAGQGAAKVQLVKNVLEASYAASKELNTTFDQVWPVLQNTITSVVAMFNATGVFKK